MAEFRNWLERRPVTPTVLEIAGLTTPIPAFPKTEMTPGSIALAT
jgi:hypothetical protein